MPVTRRVPSSPAITLLLAVCWLVFGPRTPDLAAQMHRVAVFAADGFAVWDNSWYGGHPLPGYSLTFPALGALVGARLVGAMAAVASAALFDTLVARYGHHRWASAWFAVGCMADLMIGRLTYALGVTSGLAAIVALTRRRPAAAVALAGVCAATSPVAGLFLVLAGAGFAVVSRRRDGLLVGVVAGAVVVALSLAFPEGGTQPFSAGSFAVTASISIVAALAVGADRRLRVPLLLYAAVVVVCFVVASPMGGNVVRLGTAFVAPALLLAAGQASTIRRVALVAVLIPAAAWQWIDPFTQASRGWEDPSARAAYYRPVAAALRQAGDAGGRVEVPFTRDHWESAMLARRFALARGWERQLDRRFNPLFYGRRLDPAAYHRWLRANAVAYVALPDVPMDSAGRAEAALVRGGLSYLQPLWHDEHWWLFRVRDALPLASGIDLDQTTLRLTATRPGAIVVRVRWTPFWRVVSGSGCVTRSGPWTLVRARHSGTLVIGARFAMQRLFEKPPACPP